MKKRLSRTAAFYLVIAAIVIFLLLQVFGSSDGRKSLTLTEFRRQLTGKDVATAKLYDRDHVIKGELRNGDLYSVKFPEQSTDELADAVIEAGTRLTVDNQKTNAWLSFLAAFAPLVLILAIVVFFMSQVQGAGGRMMGFGKARARLVNKEDPKVTFADVAGLDEAVEELEEIKNFLESPEKFGNMGAKIPKGVLLYGPPGTGKTLLARAIAGEAGVPFYSISGSDFVEMFVGVGASRVRNLFEQAKATAPAIIFVDEIDAVGRQRGAGLGGGHDEREQTLNQLLVEMDGFEAQQGVILIAATNRPDILDPALLRPGRFDRQVVVDRPDLEGRKAILKVHARGKPFDESVDLDVIARRTPGFTGADLANLVNESALLAARYDKKVIGHHELEEGIDRVVAGPERKSRLISDKEKLVIAYHEGGHALVSHVLPNADPVHKISIIPRGRALGYTLTLPVEDKYLVTRRELNEELAMLLGGRTAEELVFADPTTGAQNDIERATKIARSMVTEYGMSDTLGPMQFGQRSQEVFLGRDFGASADYSDDVASLIDSELGKLIDTAHSLALEILTEHRTVLDQLANALIERETLGVDEVMAILGPLPEWTAASGNGSGVRLGGTSPSVVAQAAVSPAAARAIARRNE